MEGSPPTLAGHGKDDPSYASTVGEETTFAVDDAGNNTTQQIHFGAPGTTAARTRPRRNRGRHPKDPLGQTVHFQCSRLEDFEASLREYLANPTYPAEHTTLEFSFPVTAAFLIPARESLGTRDPGDKKTPVTYSIFKKSAVSVVDALHNNADPSEQMITQKRISKSLVDTISEIDGFRYSFHNNWLSNADQANRFSYYCNDSVLNKGRAANEGLAKIRCGVKSRKPVYECAGGIWIKFSLTKNNLQLDYRHIPMHPTFEETAPVPRNGSKRRKLLEIFHPEKLPQHRGHASKDKSDPQEKNRKGKSTDEPKPLGGRKRRVAEPITQGDDASAPQSAHDRENSLQPLFDFLGSAGRLEDAGVGIRDPDTSADCDGGAVPLALGEDAADVSESRNAAGQSDKTKRHPSTKSFSVTNDETTQGSKTKPKKKSTNRSNDQPPEESVTAPVRSTAVQLQPDQAAMQERNGPALSPSSSVEIDALRQRLIEAEEKIRVLESQKQQPSQPVQPAIVPQAPPPIPPTQAQYAPPLYPQHSPPSPPSRWQYPPSGQPAYPPYPYQYPGNASQPPLPPPPAHAATLPQPYHEGRQWLPPPVPNPSPSYVFVPNPTELFATKVRPHLVPSRSQSMPGLVPIRPTPPALHNSDYVSQPHNYTASPSHAQSSAPSQSQGQSQPPSSSRPHAQTPVVDTNRPIAPYPHTPGEQHGVQA